MESLDIFRADEDRWGLGFAQINAGNLARAEGNAPLAAQRYEEAVATLRAVGDGWLITLPLCNLARFAFREGDFARAA